MEKRNVDIDIAEMEEINKREFEELVEIVDETAGRENREITFLQNNTLKERAKNNSHIKRYIDKCFYDDHNRQVAEAKAKRDEKELQFLSNRAMRFAGYIGDETEVNEYLKSFVDRTFLDREINKLYKAKERNNQEEVYEIYKRIYDMSSSETNKPFYVENEYAKGFVQIHIDEYKRMEICLPEEKFIEDEQYAI